VLFYPIEFTPDTSRFSGERCGGIAIMVTDRSKLEPIRVGMDLAWAIHSLFPEWQEERLVRLVQNQVAADAILEGGYDKAAATWQSSLAEFRKVRAKYLLYD